MTAHSAQPNPTASAERQELVLERVFDAPRELVFKARKPTLPAVVVRSTPVAAGALGGMWEGWSQSLDRLALELRRV